MVSLCAVERFTLDTALRNRLVPDTTLCYAGCRWKLYVIRISDAQKKIALRPAFVLNICSQDAPGVCRISGGNGIGVAGMGYPNIWRKDLPKEFKTDIWDLGLAEGFGFQLVVQLERSKIEI